MSIRSVSFFRCVQALVLDIVQAVIDSNLVSNWNRNKTFNIWLTAVNVLPKGITPKTATILTLHHAIGSRNSLFQEESSPVIHICNVDCIIATGNPAPILHLYITICLIKNNDKDHELSVSGNSVMKGGLSEPICRLSTNLSTEFVG